MFLFLWNKLYSILVEDEKKDYKKNSKDSHLLFAYSIKMSLWQASYFEVTECTELKLSCSTMVPNSLESCIECTRNLECGVPAAFLLLGGYALRTFRIPQTGRFPTNMLVATMTLSVFNEEAS